MRLYGKSEIFALTLKVNVPKFSHSFTISFDNKVLQVPVFEPTFDLSNKLLELLTYKC